MLAILGELKMNFLKSVTFAVLTASLVTAHGQNSLTNGLVCFYPLNGTAADSLGNGNTGTLNNGAYYTNRDAPFSRLDVIEQSRNVRICGDGCFGVLHH